MCYRSNSIVGYWIFLRNISYAWIGKSAEIAKLWQRIFLILFIFISSLLCLPNTKSYIFEHFFTNFHPFFFDQIIRFRSFQFRISCKDLKILLKIQKGEKTGLKKKQEFFRISYKKSQSSKFEYGVFRGFVSSSFQRSTSVLVRFESKNIWTAMTQKHQV